MRTNVTLTTNKLRKLEEKDHLYAWEEDHYISLTCTLANLEEELEEAINDRHEHARTSDVGFLHQILSGLDYMEEKFEEGMADGSKLPLEDMELGFIKFLETRGKGSFDFKRTGTEMTNGKGMNALDNFDQVSVGLLGMYPPGSEEHEWLKIETTKWNRLARALFEVHCFLKSQRKMDPEECDDKLYELWNAWQAAFPRMKFNKFHGLFCGTRNFIHKCHMAGRVSEESNESFNSVMANMKKMLQSMGSTVGRIDLLNYRAQVKTALLDMSEVERGKEWFSPW